MTTADTVATADTSLTAETAAMADTVRTAEALEKNNILVVVVLSYQIRGN